MSEENTGNNGGGTNGGNGAAQQKPATAGQGDTGTGTGPQATGTDTEPDYKAEAEKWRALARKHETNAKANASAATELTQIKDSQKSAEQKLNDQLAAAQVELAQYKTRETRVTAAVAAGLSPDMAEYLTEVEPDAALEQAKRLAEHLKPTAPQAAADLRQGARGGPAQQADDPNAWLRKLAGRA